MLRHQINLIFYVLYLFILSGCTNKIVQNDELECKQKVTAKIISIEKDEDWGNLTIYMEINNQTNHQIIIDGATVCRGKIVLDSKRKQKFNPNMLNKYDVEAVQLFNSGFLDQEKCDVDHTAYVAPPSVSKRSKEVHGIQARGDLLDIDTNKSNLIVYIFYHPFIYEYL